MGTYAVAFGQPVDDARHATFERASERRLYAVLIALASGPLLVFGVSVLLFAVFNGTVAAPRVPPGARRHRARQRDPGAPPGRRRAPRLLARNARQPDDAERSSPTLDEASPLARFLGVIDLFVVWWAIVLAVGVSVLYRARRVAGARVRRRLYRAAAVLTLVMASTGGTA